MRDATLHGLLQAYAADAAMRLSQDTQHGAEVDFELVEQGSGRRTPLYCYRPLVGTFIEQRLGGLRGLVSHAPAAQALAALEGTGAYLRERGIAQIPAEPRQRAEEALYTFLARVFEDRSEFEFDRDRFEAAYAELERVLYEGQALSMVIAPVLGVALDPDTDELPLGDGLKLVRAQSLTDLPGEAVWDESHQPTTLAVLSLAQERSAPPPVAVARRSFRRIVTALRLFEHGGYALGPLAWVRTDAGPWRAVAMGGSGHARLVSEVAAAQEDELRGFFNLLSRRKPGGGEIGWALARYEMGCERVAPFEALSDFLLALRALLEPEGPSSGRLAQRLSALCAMPADRPALMQRTAHAISLERAVIAGLAPAEAGADGLVAELAEHLRALLRDVLCGHLDSDLCAFADGLLVQASEPEQETLAPVQAPA